jgi:hypothetical protein
MRLNKTKKEKKKVKKKNLLKKEREEFDISLADAEIVPLLWENVVCGNENVYVQIFFS